MNEAGKRSKSKQLDKIETENGKPGKCNLNKLPYTNSGFSPWHYFASVSAEVRWSEDSMPKKPWKESFHALFYDKFPAQISVSRAYLEP